ncbi:major facilitator superfamily protein [Salmonella enterica subsp. enterica]|uniref:Major facilitator superfamily protein n=1 Tax=Salmonella enterica I TaxID=59201 RepID=A0A3S4INV9_SALET|nr:major facilitator superfamily protein [Salmonella enterica subsp. enterica]
MMSIEIEKPTTRGRWLHIIPATILVYIVAYMDRTNIAIGIAGGMDEDLGMTASFAGLVAGIFFIGYIFLQNSRRSDSRAAKRQEVNCLDNRRLGGLCPADRFCSDTDAVVDYPLCARRGGRCCVSRHFWR